MPGPNENASDRAKEQVAENMQRRDERAAERAEDKTERDAEKAQRKEDQTGETPAPAVGTPKPSE